MYLEFNARLTRIPDNTDYWFVGKNYLVSTDDFKSYKINVKDASYVILSNDIFCRCFCVSERKLNIPDLFAGYRNDKETTHTFIVTRKRKHSESVYIVNAYDETDARHRVTKSYLGFEDKMDVLSIQTIMNKQLDKNSVYML